MVRTTQESFASLLPPRTVVACAGASPNHTLTYGPDRVAGGVARQRSERGSTMADKSGEQIGIVGIGRMGLAMAKHLIKHGYRVIACDLDRKQCDAARAAGAAVAATPAEVGKAVRFVIIGVGYDDEATAVMLGEHGLLETMDTGSIVAISSTCTPEHVKTLDEQARKKGVDVFDAPICRGARAAAGRRARDRSPAPRPGPQALPGSPARSP